MTGCTGWTGCTTATGSVAVGAEPVKRGREELDFLTANTQSCFRQHMTKAGKEPDNMAIKHTDGSQAPPTMQVGLYLLV